jgi:hypothetical protein
MQSTLSTGGSKAGEYIVKRAVPSDDAVKFGFSIKETVHASGLSRSLIYLAIAEGKLCARKCRGRTLILREDLQQFLASLPSIKAA